MGEVFCCRKVITFPTTNQFLFQLNRFIEKSKKPSQLDNNSNNNNEILNNSSNSENNISENSEKKEKKIIINRKPKNLKENLISQNGKFKFLFYDITQNNSIIMEKKLEIVKTVEGLSELNFNHKLYLCGNSKLENNEGSFLFELDPYNPKTKILVNSIYGHYYPSLINYQNKYIFCIGGKKQIHCEAYDIVENYWQVLPNLPEERYMCTLCLDSKNDLIYLFGGINSRKENTDKKCDIYIENDYILRLKKGMFMIWEKIEIKDENKKNLLKRISAGSLVFDDQPDNIYILGGENEQKNYLDDIIVFNVNSFNLSKTNQKINFPTIFFNQYAKKCENGYSYVFMDKFNKVIEIDEHDFIEWSYDKLEK